MATKTEQNHQAVMQYVAAALKRNPDLSSSVLHDRASEKFPHLRRMNVRAFHARYPLQVKRGLHDVAEKKEAARAEKKEVAAAAKKEVTMEAAARPRDLNGARVKVKQVLIDWAKALTNAEGQEQLITTVGSIDDYIDRIEKAVMTA